VGGETRRAGADTEGGETQSFWRGVGACGFEDDHVEGVEGVELSDPEAWREGERLRLNPKPKPSTQNPKP
jgi:hypothetical protein